VVLGRSLFSEKKGTYDQNPAERKQVMMPDIDKVVVVTGASSGIGESTATPLPDEGASDAKSSTDPDSCMFTTGHPVF